MIKDNEICFIVQGPIYNNGSQKTSKTILSIRKYYPNSEIILSTWNGENYSGLDFDEIVISNDPGGFNAIDVWNDKVFTVNTNRQIKSTFEALKKTKKKYVAKIRSDSLIVNNNLINLLANKYEKFRHTFFNSRIITLPSYNPKKPIYGSTKNKIYISLNVPDWYFIGHYEDIFNFFDIEYQKISDFSTQKVNGVFKAGSIGPTEQYLVYKLIQKNNLDIEIKISNKKLENKLIKISNEILVSNFTFYSSNKLGIINQKYLHSSYGNYPIRSAGMFTRNEWIKIYNNYSQINLKFSFYYLEKIVYFILFNIRIILVLHSNRTYNFIRKIKNRK
jgi:hypothetical protein